MIENGNESTNESLYASFFRYLTGSEHVLVESAWRARLRDVCAVPFPAWPSADSVPSPDTVVGYTIEDVHVVGDDANVAAILWTAWALLAAAHTETDDVVFGALIPRRGQRVPAVAPIRVLVDPDASVVKQLETTLALYNEATRFRRVGRHWIRQLGKDEDQACAFQTLLQIQRSDNPTREKEEEEEDMDPYGNFALLLWCLVKDNCVRLTFRFDSAAIEAAQVRRMAAHLGDLTRRLTRSAKSDGSSTGSSTLLVRGETILIPVIDEDMADSPSSCMMPAAYIPPAEIPMTRTGKTDRQRLRETVSAMNTEQLSDFNAAHRQGASTASEHALQRLWASILDVDRQTISVHDNFFRIGGDSQSAMRLVKVAREEGFSFSFADVFQSPCLADLANRSSSLDEDGGGGGGGGADGSDVAGPFEPAVASSL